MEFCTITPIAGLQQYGTALSKRHLVLAHMLYNKEYYEYYSLRRRAGDFIILDNGAYENTRPLDSAAYFNWILDLHPHVAVLPDILMSPWRETTSVALKFLDRFGDDPRLKDYITEWMFVPQIEKISSVPTDFWQSMLCAVNDGRQGHKITWLGLGRYLATNWSSNTRPTLAREIKVVFPHLKLHALGMAAGDLDELKGLRDAGVESIDSSAPVWRGWQGYGIRDPQWSKTGTPCDFHAAAPKAQSTNDLIEVNLEEVQNALNG